MHTLPQIITQGHFVHASNHEKTTTATTATVTTTTATATTVLLSLLCMCRTASVKTCCAATRLCVGGPDAEASEPLGIRELVDAMTVRCLHVISAAVPRLPALPNLHP